MVIYVEPRVLLGFSSLCYAMYYSGVATHRSRCGSVSMLYGQRSSVVTTRSSARRKPNSHGWSPRGSRSTSRSLTGTLARLVGETGRSSTSRVITRDEFYEIAIALAENPPQAMRIIRVFNMYGLQPGETENQQPRARWFKLLASPDFIENSPPSIKRVKFVGDESSFQWTLEMLVVMKSNLDFHVGLVYDPRWPPCLLCCFRSMHTRIMGKTHSCSARAFRCGALVPIRLSYISAMQRSSALWPTITKRSSNHLLWFSRRGKLTAPGAAQSRANSV
jgi:hypothetical protein